MSLILDALNRADQERSVENNTPGLQSAHYTAPANGHSLRRWIIEALVVLAVISGFYLYSQRDQPAATAAEAGSNTMESVGQAINSTPAAVSKPPLAVNPPATNTAAKVESNKVQAMPAQAIQLQTTIAPSIKVQATEPPTASANAAIDSLYQRQTTTTASTAAVAEPAANTTQVVTPAAAATRPSAADKTQTILASIPLLSQHSLSFQRRIPSIEYSVHAYAEGGGFVMLNGKRYRVGDMLQPQLRVIAILPDSLVLDYQQRQFRLMALNSWINI